MPVRPLHSEVHVDVAVTKMSVAWLQALTDFVARRIFPVVRTDKASNDYYEFLREFWNRSMASKMAPGSAYPGSGYGLKTARFNCEKRGITHPMPIEVEANADEVLEIKSANSQFVMRQLLLLEEIEWAASYFKTGIWTTNLDGSGADFTQFNLANGDPIVTFRNQMRVVKELTGLTPNKLLLGKKTFDIIVDNDAVIDRIKSTVASSTGQVISQADEITLAQSLGLSEVMVASAIKNTAVEIPGVVSETNDFILEETGALLVYAAPAPSRFVPSGGYTFVQQNPILKTNSQGMVFSDWLEDRTDSLHRRGASYYDQKLVSADLGVYFTNCTT